MDTKFHLQTLKSLLTLPHLRAENIILPPENGMLGKWQMITLKRGNDPRNVRRLEN